MRNYLAGFEKVFTPEASAFFDENGYFVFSADPMTCSSTAASSSSISSSPSPFTDEEARKFQLAIKAAYFNNKFHQNKVEFLLASGPIQLVKPNVFEYDLHSTTANKDVPLMHDLFRNHMGKIATFLKNASTEFGEREHRKTQELTLGKEGAEIVRMRDLMTSTPPPAATTSSSAGASSSSSQFIGNGPTPCSSTFATLTTLKTDPANDMTLKLQVNTGGCFPWHYDNPSPPNKRLLTLAVYLTDPYDESTDGGHIQLLPFLGKPVTIAPKFNTVVLFRSDLMLHRVIPFKKKIGSNSGKNGGNSSKQQQQQQQNNFRCCFTVWIDGECTNMSDDVNLKAKNLVADFIPHMMISPVQRSLSRAVYDDIYQKALVDCFGDKTREAMISLRLHEAHVKQLTANPALVQFIELLKSKREY